MFGLENMVTLIIRYLSRRETGSGKDELEDKDYLEKEIQGFSEREARKSEWEQESRKQLGDCCQEAISGFQRHW